MIRIMRYLTTAFTLFIFLACSDDNIQKTERIKLETNPEWLTEKFKKGYTIQFPDNYDGEISGFEGNTFSKVRSDKAIRFNYRFCSALFCSDFGKALVCPPKSVSIPGNDNDQLALTFGASFLQNDEIVGLFYFNDLESARGLYYMKRDGQFREALNVWFPNSAYEEVISILKTIRQGEI